MSKLSGIRILPYGKLKKKHEVEIMPRVTIIKPNITKEQKKKALRNIAEIMEQIVEEELGAKVEIELIDKKQEKLT